MKLIVSFLVVLFSSLVQAIGLYSNISKTYELDQSVPLTKLTNVDEIALFKNFVSDGVNHILWSNIHRLLANESSNCANDLLRLHSGFMLGSRWAIQCELDTIKCKIVIF